jgi:hypothetical protein
LRDGWQAQIEEIGVAATMREKEEIGSDPGRRKIELVVSWS